MPHLPSQKAGVPEKAGGSMRSFSALRTRRPAENLAGSVDPAATNMAESLGEGPVWGMS